MSKVNFMKKLFIAIAALVVLFGTIYFLANKPQTPTDTNKIKVTASFYPLYYFTHEIAGDKASVVNLTPSGVEPHDYEPTPREIAQLQENKLLIINGAGLEPWIEKLSRDLTAKGVTTITATDGISLQDGEAQEEETQQEGSFKDPHVWLSPVLAQKQAEKILQGLITVDPQNKSYYEANAKNLQEKLTALDQKYKSGLSTCQQKEFVTSHAAFAYLAKEYGLTMTSIAGLSPEKEPSAAELAEVATFAKENNVNYIFFETLVSPKLSETVANEIGAKTLVLDPIEGIGDDEISKGANYFTVMEDNLQNLQEALQCKK